MEIPSSDHDTIQSRVHDILRNHGQTPDVEHPLPRYHPGSDRLGYIDAVSMYPIRIGIEIDHSVPRHKSIDELNYFNGELSIVVLRGAAAGHRQKSKETAKRCAKFKTQYAVLNLTDKQMILSSIVKPARK
jgi:hypothetical protein